MSKSDYDVVIVGGGPAGSTAAAFLSRSGHRVLVLEKEQFPRFQIGESLLPFSMDTLDRMGLGDKLAKAGFLPKHGAHISSGCGTKEIKFFFENGFRSRRKTALQVPRAEFDYLLLEHARECGAEVRYRTRVADVNFGEETVQLETDCLETSARESFSCRFLLDCSGRNSVVGSKFKLRQTYPHLRKFAVFAHYDNVFVADGPEGTLTNMIRETDRWFWIIPLSRRKISLGVVTDLEIFKESGQQPENFFEAAIARQPLVRERLQGSSRVTPVHATGDYSFRNTSFFGDRWLLAGDAAGFIDPVFSSGVFLAIYSGENAASAIGEALCNPQRAPKVFRSYERSLNKVMDLYQNFVEGWYKQEFVETVLNPQEFFQLVPAVNAVLAGHPGRSWAIRWRLWIFQIIVRLQRHLPLSPKVSLNPP
jgi:flavin-dependent dehydrogenase